MTLRDLRINSGIKVNKVAEELGISKMQVFNIEKGKTKKLDEFKVKKLAELYRVSESEVIVAWGLSHE